MQPTSSESPKKHLIIYSQQLFGLSVQPEKPPFEGSVLQDCVKCGSVKKNSIFNLKWVEEHLRKMQAADTGTDSNKAEAAAADLWARW